jgi:DNA-directed RNA polymerase subunit RPC12/RpoP
MRIICFLREAGVPINRIGELFSEEHPEKIISILLDQQEKELREEISDSQKKLGIVESIKRELREIPNFSVESIGDIAYIMKNKNNLSKMRWFMVLTGIPVTALQWISIVLWITHGLWWLFAIYVAVAIPWGCAVSSYYFSHVSYLCPGCHKVFKPRLREILLAYHTPRMRRLTCPACGHKNLCLEIYTEGAEKKNG